MAGASPLASQLMKFSAVGTLAFIVDISLYNVLRLTLMAESPIWAKVVSVAAATTLSWLGSRYWTFKDGRQPDVWREAAMFAAINAIGLGIAMACLFVSHYLLGATSTLADNISGNVVGVALGNVFRFVAYRAFLFRPSPASLPMQGEERERELGGAETAVMADQ